MKPISSILLFAAALCYAQESSDISVKIREIDRDKDGKPESRTEMVYRGKAKLLYTTDMPNGKGGMAKSRMFFVAGDWTMMESDEDGDGHFETFFLRDPATEDLEVFKRGRDGSVQAVSTSVLELHKQGHALVGELGRVMSALMEGEIDMEKATSEAAAIRKKSTEIQEQLRKQE